MALEVKSSTGKLSAEQAAWIEALTAAGVPALVIRLGDFDAVAELLR